MQRDKEIDFGNASSSKQPRWDVVPRRALLRLIQRFEMGLERKGDKAWHARSQNQDCLTNHEFVVSRIVHVINHAYALLDKLEGRIPDDGDDDAGAIAWGGIFLCEATDAKRIKELAAKRIKELAEERHKEFESSLREASIGPVELFCHCQSPQFNTIAPDLCARCGRRSAKP